ncbi:hypothetical protein NDU88_005872 [Pleurodeles waltl]|uniref:Uncharacterized protein n=1 Tax=Pleurodeles waltl TaxID=8319 RepID=A0AAV7PLQ1_PLEWA|nr:hypothetical protein NDU88_005872 [Pleurodeles waltl]
MKAGAGLYSRDDMAAWVLEMLIQTALKQVFRLCRVACRCLGVAEAHMERMKECLGNILLVRGELSNSKEKVPAETDSQSPQCDGGGADRNPLRVCASRWAAMAHWRLNLTLPELQKYL